MAVLFALTSFWAAFLLFSVQPLVARMLLPTLGGAPMVWNTAMVFFQAVLLGGYFYAFWLGKRLERAPLAALAFHGVLLLAPLAVLPIALAPNLSPPSTAHPIGWLLGVLALLCGVPFALVSTCSPYLQRTFALTSHRDAHDPYFLYAASNVGSFCALLAYPLFWEPNFGLSQQSHFWSWGYGALLILLWACAIVVWKTKAARASANQVTNAMTDTAPVQDSFSAKGGVAEPVTWKRRGRWVILAFVPSSLMLSVTMYLSSNIAALPLLWVGPLALYLLSFVVVFARRQWVPTSFWARALALMLLPLIVAVAVRGSSPLEILLPLHVGVFALAALVLHGELARDRPPASHGPEFYGWMALGGVLGGVFNAILAPLLFSDVWEYDLTLVLVAALVPRELLITSSPPQVTPRAKALPWLPAFVAIWCALTMLFVSQNPNWHGSTSVALIFGLPTLLVFALSRHPALFALGVAAILAPSALLFRTEQGEIIKRERSFFGVHTVRRDKANQLHWLAHGSTIHGVWNKARPREPLSYYARVGPAGRVFGALETKSPLQTQVRRVGVVGLGGGALAAYAQPGQQWTFFEIDPLVARLASDPQLFGYLSGARGENRIVLGDARLRLQEAPDGAFDVLVLDAYSSDAIPLHLLTREALALYGRKLAADGVILWHLSNNFFDLEPVVGRLGRENGWQSRILNHNPTPAQYENHVMPSLWAVLTRREAVLKNVTQNGAWRPLKFGVFEWTDERASLWPLIQQRLPLIGTGEE